MGLIGTTLVLVSFAFFGSVAAHKFAETERDPHRSKLEKAATITVGIPTQNHGTNFLGNGERCFYSNGDTGVCKNGE
uniref:Putative tick salivary peptide group 1 n=1 Tax=Ixodes ricinus TaxID=34613 RepID=V5HV26_IXORI